MIFNIKKILPDNLNCSVDAALRRGSGYTSGRLDSPGKYRISVGIPMSIHKLFRSLNKTIYACSIIVIMLTFVVLPGANLYSQGGSNYSVFGIGDINHSIGASYDGLAGTSIGFISKTGINYKNPAMWSHAKQTRLQMGYRFRQNIVDNGKERLYQNNGSIDGILGLFAIAPDYGLSVSFGLYPYSNVNFLATSPLKAVIDDITIEGKSTYQGSGGLSEGYFGASVNLTDDISLGLAAIGTFGKIKYSTETKFYNTSTFISMILREDKFNGYGFRAGLSVTSIENLTIGAFYEKRNVLNLTSELIYQTSFSLDTSISENSTFVFPDAFGIGASWLTGKFRIGADISFQDFSNFAYNRGIDSSLRNSMQISAGAERIGSKSINAKSFDKIAYKFGIGYNQLYYSVNGSNINEYFGALGMTLPMEGTGVIDAAIVFGTRGTTDNGLLRENFARISVNISIGELWFKPFKRDYD